MDGSLITPEEAGANSRINYPKLIAKKNVICMDCKLRWHPVSMTLDHRNRDTKHLSDSGRRLDPSRMITRSPELFDEMLDYCDPVCGNCHKIREMRRDHTIFNKRWKMFSYHLGDGALMKDI